MMDPFFSKQLEKLVVENIFAFNEDFWIRLAARSDSCKSDDDKAWFSSWLQFFTSESIFLTIAITFVVMEI